jgi:hypothetical protein
MIGVALSLLHGHQIHRNDDISLYGPVASLAQARVAKFIFYLRCLPCGISYALHWLFQL